jgi:hypothetical protein
VKAAGHNIQTEIFFDTFTFEPKNGQNEIMDLAKSKKINLRYYSNGQVMAHGELLIISDQ